MSTEQITVRIPRELVEFLDEHVSKKGAAASRDTVFKSRAAFLTALLVKEQREERDQRDAAIYAEHGEDPDLAGLGQWGSANAARVWADLD